MIQSRVHILAVVTTCAWPEPLGHMMACGEAQARVTRSLHEAAAIWIRRTVDYQAMVLDTTAMTRREIELLGLLQLHMPLPMWLLPTCETPDRMRTALSQGACPWEVAARKLAERSHEASTPVIRQGNREDLMTWREGRDLQRPRSALPLDARADKRGRDSVWNSIEIPLASEVAPSYDGGVMPPALNDREVRQLLGTARAAASDF